MMRVRLVVLGLLLLATAVFFLIYQYSDTTVVRTRILPSRTLHKDRRRYSSQFGVDIPLQDEMHEVDVNGEGANVRLDGGQGQGLDDLGDLGDLARLGTSELARRLQQQAEINQKEAARLREERRKLDVELFNIKVEKGRQAGVEIKLSDREKSLADHEKALKEERQRLSEERIFGRPLRKTDNTKVNGKRRLFKVLHIDELSANDLLKGAGDQPSETAKKQDQENYSNANKKLPQNVYRNPLSVQGANVKNYIKEMNKNFHKFRDINETEYEKEKPVYIQEMKELQANSNNNNNNPSDPANSTESTGKSSILDTPVLKRLKKLDKNALAKLPLIEQMVEQGHFGYEHGRNAKGSSREKKSYLSGTADAANGNRSKANKTVIPTGTPDPKSERGWINTDLEDIWEGLEPRRVAQRHPGIMLDGTYMLRRFIDPSDIRASGMEGNPQTIDDMSEAAAEERFYQLVTGDQMQCADIQRLGNYGDGGWDMCASGPYKPKVNCLVYSFGINNDFSFDDGISNKYGCEVKAFDPSMSRPDLDNGGADMNVGDHMHSSKVHFFNLGLGAADGINSQAWQLRTFGSILKRLGHDNRVIDFLKIDIEFNEWSCFKTMLKERSLKNVKQLVFEIHTSEVYTINKQSRKENFLEWYTTLMGLEKLGFRRYHHHYNPNGQYTSSRTGKERTCCYELYYVNIRFLK